MDWSFDIECESEDDMLPQSNPQVVVNIPALTIPDLPTIDTTALLPLCSSPTPGPSTIADYIQVQTPMPPNNTEEDLPILMDIGDVLDSQMSVDFTDLNLEVPPMIDQPDVSPIIELISQLQDIPIPSVSPTSRAESQPSTSSMDLPSMSENNTQTPVRFLVDNSTQTSPLDIVRDVCYVKALPQNKPQDATPTRVVRPPIQILEPIYIDSDSDVENPQ